jgi:membrane protease subunit HflC
MKRSALVIAFLLVAAIIGFSASAYVVSETEQVIVTEFGEPVGEAIAEAGLHWRVPFIQKVHRFEKRLLAFDGDPEQLPTKDKKYIFIDTFARWRIVDPLQFFKAVRDERGAQARLDDIIDAATRDAISNNPLIEAVRDSNRELKTDDSHTAEAGTDALPDTDVVVDVGAAVFAGSIEDLPPVERGRSLIRKDIFESARGKVGAYGIELIDVQIKRINYVEEVRARVYERMISEREQIAEKYRSEGQQFLLGFNGKITREKDSLLSEAYAKAEGIKAEGDAEAARIYAEAYGQDPEFYLFWRTLQFYRENLGDNTTLVIGTDSDLFRYLVSGSLLSPGGAAGE